MFDPNVNQLITLLRPDDKVLDIGGWARPFNRANFVIDAEPYDTRGYYGASRPAQGGERERFSNDTWIVRDICEKTPFPFRDKEIDYVICSHTLEDIRDPLFVCSEMRRIAKAGYIEVPSRMLETCRGVEPGQVGWTHHRWLIDIDETARSISFLMKFHMIHSSFRFSFPAKVAQAAPPERQVQWLFWEGDFTFGERTIHGVENIAAELESFVAKVRPYSAARLAAARALSLTKNQLTRAARGTARRVLGQSNPSGNP